MTLRFLFAKPYLNLRSLAWLPLRIRLPILCGIGLGCLWTVMIAVTWYLNHRFSSSLMVSDLPELALAFGGLLLKPAMPKHCPVAVNDGGMSNSYKARTYDAQIILHRNELGSKNPNTLHRLSKWGVHSAEEWRSYAYQAAHKMEMRDGVSVYEIGVGTGAFLHALQMKYKNLELAGSDLSAQAVVIANQVLGPQFCYANAYNLSYATADHYDFVIASGVFLVAAETEAETIDLVKQAVSLLKPKTGKLFVGYNSVHIPGSGPTGDGRINLRTEFWTENSKLLKLTNVVIVNPSAFGGSSIKYDVYATRAAEPTPE
jgi:hypothetical protein